MIKNDPNDIKRIDEKLYGIYRGVIEDNDDREEFTSDEITYRGTGRCRIRVWGIHTKKKSKTVVEGIPTNELPWAEPANSILGGSITGVGLWGVPVQGSHVFVFFENGDHMQPRYFATVPGINQVNSDGDGYINTGLENGDGFQDPDEGYPNTDLCEGKADKKEPDMNRLARGDESNTAIENIALQKIVDGLSDACEPNLSYAPVYPHDMVLETPGGHVIELDSTPDNERMLVYHPSNTYMEINNDGRIIDKGVDNRHEITIGNRTICIQGDDTHIVLGNRTESITKSWSMSSLLGMSLTDAITITITAPTVYISSATYLGGASIGGVDTKALATEDHVHCGVQKGNDCTGPPDSVTTNTWAV